jgi:hypothetical protein
VQNIIAHALLAEADTEPSNAGHGSITVAASTETEYKAADIRRYTWPLETQPITAFITGI